MDSDAGGEVDAVTLGAWKGVVTGVEPHFDVYSRDSGRELFSAREVELGACSPKRASGVVSGHGTAIEREELARGVRYEFSCECPRGQAERPCAHNFALALALEASAETAARERVQRAASEPSHLRVSRERLARLSDKTPAVSAEGTEWRVLYRLAPGAAEDRAALRLSVLAQRRRRDGQWGAERPLDSRTRRELRLDDPRDRRALSLLEGAHDTDHEFSAAINDGRRYVLTGERVGLLLPELARTGRLGWAESDPESAGLVVDEGEPWSATLRFEREEEDGDGRIEADLERGDEHRSSAEIVAAAGDGWWLDRERIGRLEPAIATPWVAELAGQRALAVPREHEDAWLGALAAVATSAGGAGLDRAAGRPHPARLWSGAWPAGGGG
ncbi:MAG: hypothetical protein AAFZ65_03280, partial [Planctomycetota bacterium]